MKTRFIQTVCFLLFTTSLVAQKTSFDIIALDKNIGTATIDKKVLSENKYTLDYTFDAVLKFLFITTTVDMDVNVVYQNNQMIGADLRYQQNEKIMNRKYSYADGQYNVVTDGKNSSFNKKAYATIMNFYEKEPIGVTEVFLEKQNEFAPLKNLGNHEYLIVVDGDKCTYSYKDGKLQKAHINATIDFHIVRRN